MLLLGSLCRSPAPLSRPVELLFWHLPIVLELFVCVHTPCIGLNALSAARGALITDAELTEHA